MKHLKAKLLTSVVMLLVAAVMMSTASYAWFTLSTNPELKDMTVNVVVNEGLEIAYRNSDTAPQPNTGTTPETGMTTKYGNLVATSKGGIIADDDPFTTDFADFVDDSGTTLRPATLSSGKFLAPVYGDDGRVASIDKELVATLTSGTGFGVIEDSTTNEIYGYFVQLWVRTNVEGNLQISGPSVRSTGAAAAKAGAGSYFDATTGTGIDTAKEALAKGFGVAYSLDGGTITALTFDAVSGNIKNLKTGANNSLGTITANVDHKLTIYLYLEGANVTNSAASITGKVATGILNLQFQNDAITAGSMDAQN